MQRILILGATSRIARFVAYEFAKEGATLYLAGRDTEELQRTAEDISIRFQTPVYTGFFEVLDFENHEAFLCDVLDELGGLDGIVLVLGHLGDQDEAKHNPEVARYLIDTNFMGPAFILTLLADYLEQQGSGFIAGISSVAGDRGRQSNYVYGASKGALSLFLQGLRNRLQKTGVKVITVKLGFVDTRMTFGKEKLFFLASPERIGTAIHGAIGKGYDVVYLPFIWFPIMLFIKAIPEKLFKKLKL